ncbi:hypothetical protein [Cupriavidus sp. 8B]
MATTLDAALLDLLLKTNPFVWEIRCHYPLCVRGRAGPLIIERMVTVERSGLPGVPHLHAVMCSHTDFQKFKKHLDREGVSSEVFDASSISPLQIQNASFSYGVARRMNIREPKTRECAARLAQRIYESDRRSVRRRALGADRKYRECTLDRLLTRLARREGMTLAHTYALFGVAMILGFVCVAPGHELNPLTPLRLSFPLVRAQA